MKPPLSSFDDFRETGHYDIVLRTGTGQRESQQDAAYVAATDDEVFAVLCDGMGGTVGGALASFTAVKEFASYFQRHHSESDWMRSAVEVVDDVIFSLCDEQGKRLGAGTTLVAVHLSDDHLNWISVGDSRLYIIRREEMMQITQDHNYWLRLNEQRKKGAISDLAYQREASKGDALISYIGMGGLVLIDVSQKSVRLADGDTLVLCSDGVYRSIPGQVLRSVITSSCSATEAADRIAKQLDIYASCHHDQDNFTYILIRKEYGGCSDGKCNQV